MSSAMRAAVALTLPMSPLMTETPPVRSSSSASSGRTCWSAAASTVPTSATVSVRVSWSRRNNARCTSRTPDRNSAVNAGLVTTSPVTDSMIGRAAIRSRLFLSTTWSVIRSAISVFTLSARNASVARLANWSESTSAWRA
jgi:hypothetical protein